MKPCPLSQALRRATLALVACLFLVFGCTPPPRPPAPERLRVVADPSAAPLLDELAAQYRARHSYLTLEVSERSTEAALGAVARGEADLSLIERDLESAEVLDTTTWKAGLHTWPIGRGALAIVVHPSNPVQGLSHAELEKAFSGAARSWAGLGGEDRTLKLVTREAGAPARLLLEREVLQGSPVAGSAVVMPNDRAVAEYVAAHPEAIGYLAAPWAASEVKAIAVDGVLPSPAAVVAGDYPLTYPLVLVTPAAFSSKAKGLIDYCLGQEGQAIVGQTYAPVQQATGNPGK